MPTTVTKTIGTSSRDYSTLQAWEDACPANLVTDDKIWRGECYNDAEFTNGSSALLSIGGITADATRYVDLTAAAGQSFQDHASVRTNALKYDQSNGVGLRNNPGYGAVILCAVAFTHISRLQIKDGSGGQYCIQVTSGNSLVLKDLILSTTGSNFCLSVSSSNTLINVLSFNSSTGGHFDLFSGNLLVGCAAIRTTDQSATGTAFVNNYNSNILKSSCCFGFSTVTSGSWSAASTNNATNLASGLPGSNNQHNVTFNSTSPFTNSSVASQNSIPVTGTNLSANGFQDATNAPNDITGTARSATPTIGVWELASASLTVPPLRGPTESYLVDGRLTL